MTFFGPDGAVYQDGIKVSDKDWTDTDFMAWRVIHQSGKKDITFDLKLKEAEEHNVPFAAYVWVDKMGASSKSRYTDNALKDKSIPIMVDWEDPGCTFTNMCSYVEAMRKLGYKVTLLYTGRPFWQSMGSPKLDDLGMDLVISRYGDQNIESRYGKNPKFECVPRYEYMLPKYSVWDWNLGGLTPSMWQFGSRIRWGDRYMDMNAIRDKDVIDRCFKNWFSEPTPIPTEEDVMLLAKLKEDVPEFGLGAGAFLGGNIVFGASHLSGAEVPEVLKQYVCKNAETLTVVTDWSQVTGITAAQFRQRFGRRSF